MLRGNLALTLQPEDNLLSRVGVFLAIIIFYQTTPLMLRYRTVLRLAPFVTLTPRHQTHTKVTERHVTKHHNKQHSVTSPTLTTRAESQAEDWKNRGKTRKNHNGKRPHLAGICILYTVSCIFSIFDVCAGRRLNRWRF